MIYKKEELEKVVKISYNYCDVARKLGLSTYYGNRQTIKKYIQIFEIDTTHFTSKNGQGVGGKRIKKSLDEILVVNSTYNQTTDLKNRLYAEGLKTEKCELCGQTNIWFGKKISLILDHINGIHNDNRIENLRIVCPNCNATLDTNGGKNINNGV